MRKLIFSIFVLLLSTSFVNAQEPSFGQPFEADLTERLLKDDRSTVVDTPLQVKVHIRAPNSELTTLFSISALFDGIAPGNEIAGLWFHCTATVEADHDAGLGSGAFIEYISRDLLIFTQDSGFIRTNGFPIMRL